MTEITHPEIILQNNQIKLTINPDISRITDFGFQGQKSIFYKNKNLENKVFPLNTDSEFWPNYGGYKIWNAPQAIWEWPPDPFIDHGRCNVIRRSMNHIDLIGAPSYTYGITINQSIWLNPNDNHVHISVQMLNISRKTQHWSIWDVTQLEICDNVIMSASDKEVYDGVSYQILVPQPKIEHSIIEIKDHLIIKPFQSKGKIGFAPSEGWVAYQKDDQLYIKTFDIFSKVYPHQGDRVEIYMDEDYMELEVLSPLEFIHTDGFISFEEDWWLYKLSNTKPSQQELLAELSSILEKIQNKLENTKKEYQILK